MPKVIYEVVLSPDGKPSVSVRSDDPRSLEDALPLAKQLQERLLRSAEAELSPGTLKQLPIQEPDREPPQAPVCQVHATPMVRMHGRRGPF
jgi:hypothetical protein